jgi:hypothetical protein
LKLKTNNDSVNKKIYRTIFPVKKGTKIVNKVFLNRFQQYTHYVL